MKLYHPCLVTAIFLFGSMFSYSQGDRCSSIQPFCAGDSQLVFPNSHPGNSNQTAAESGPNYFCLDRTPYPAWFYLQIEQSGDLEFLISQNTKADGSGDGLDVDFIVWGPFDLEDDLCSDESLSEENKVDCSFSRASNEVMVINNAMARDVYVVMITNYAALLPGRISAGFISLQQTNSGGGSTDCSILNFSLGEDRILCGENSYILDAEDDRADGYRWFVFDEVSNNYEIIQNETGSKLLVTESGYYRVEVINNVQDEVVSDEIAIEFFDQPEANKPDTIIGCDSGEGAVYDLTRAEEGLIGNNTGDYTSNYYLTDEDFQNNNPIADPENFEDDVQMVFATIISELSQCESLPVLVSLEIADIPDIGWNEFTAVCTDEGGNFLSPISLGEDLGDGYIYNWSPTNDRDGDGIENPILILNDYPSGGNVTLEIVNTITGCINYFSTEILRFSPPLDLLVEIRGSDFESNGYTVSAEVEEGNGDPAVYEYRLNNGPWQLDNIFRGVPGGTHTITARNIDGCGNVTSDPFRLVGYPRFFTPNGDGYNDTWNVINDASISITRVIIFDRYGKLIKQLDPASGGWDGTFNGRELPADDYWFLVYYRGSESVVEEYKGNFTLKR